MIVGSDEDEVRASADVVVIDERTSEEQVASTPLEAHITVILGEKVELTGFGLQAQVQGRLAVNEVPGQPTAGSGEIRIQAGQRSRSHSSRRISSPSGGTAST